MIFCTPDFNPQIKQIDKKQIGHPSTIFRTYPSEIGSPKLHRAGGAGRHTQTDTDILTGVFSCEVRRRKGIIALRKETNVVSSVWVCVGLWLNVNGEWGTEDTPVEHPEGTRFNWVKRTESG